MAKPLICSSITRLMLWMHDSPGLVLDGVRSNLIAQAGRPYGNLPRGFAHHFVEVEVAHRAFGSMFDAPGAAGRSARRRVRPMRRALENVAHRFPRALACLGFAVMSSGCAFIPFLVPPLVIEAVEADGVVDWRRRPERPGGAPSPEIPSLMALKLTVRAEQNLPAYARRHAVYLTSHFSLCRHGEFDWRRRVDGGGFIHGTDPDAPSGPMHSFEGRRDSTVYLFIHTDPQYFVNDVEASDWALGHDLRRDAADICLRILTSQMFQIPVHSNTFVIPYATIRAALDRAGM